LAVSCLGSARAEPELRWAVVDWPPSFVLPQGKTPARFDDLGDGQFDRLFQELAQRLPEYAHRPELVNSARLWHFMGTGQALCAGPVRRSPERLQVAYLTPAVRLAPVSLVVRAAEAGSFMGADGRASIAELRARHELRGRLEAARSYGAALDLAVAASPPLPRESTARVGQLVEFVAVGRYDYALEYAHVVEYLRRSGRIKAELASLPLKEAEDWELGYMACPRTPWGHAAITAIDRAIRQAATAPAFREAYLRWLPPAVRQAQQGPMEQFYDARAKGGPQIE
jgi:uncharacterized protein (TIGR02285 family)